MMLYWKGCSNVAVIHSLIRSIDRGDNKATTHHCLVAVGKLFTLIAFAEVLNVCMKGGSLVMPTVNLECGAVCISVIYVVLNKFSLFCETSAFAILKHIIIVNIF
jgi:hypothetical protein